MTNIQCIHGEPLHEASRAMDDTVSNLELVHGLGNTVVDFMPRPEEKRQQEVAARAYRIPETVTEQNGVVVESLRQTLDGAPGSVTGIIASLRAQLAGWNKLDDDTSHSISLTKNEHKSVAGAYRFAGAMASMQEGLRSLLKSGDGYSADDVWTVLDVGWRICLEAKRSIQKLIPPSDVQSGLSSDSIDMMLNHYMDVTVPHILQAIPRRKLTTEVLRDDFELHHPMAKRTMDNLHTIDQNGALVNARGLVLLQAKRYGFKDLPAYYKYLAHKNNRTEGEGRSIERPAAFLPLDYDVLPQFGDTNRETYDKQDRAYRFLTDVIGLDPTNAVQIQWANRHADRSVLEAMKMLASLKQEYGFDNTELADIYEGAGLVEAGRYSPNQLLTMRRFLDGDKATIDHMKKGPLTVCITDRTADYSAAFRKVGTQFATDKACELFFEIDDTSNGMRTLENINDLLQTHGLRPARLVLSAHGSEDQRMQFGDTVLDANAIASNAGEWAGSTELDRLLKCCLPISPDSVSQLVLLSCSQGSSNEQGVSMGGTLARRAGEGVNVYAPPVKTNIKSNGGEQLQFIGSPAVKFTMNRGKLTAREVDSIPGLNEKDRHG